MKKSMLIFLLLWCILIARAQFTTPGTGQVFTLSDISTLSPPTITQTNGIFYLHKNLTLSTGDTLKIETDDSVLVSPNVLITINGVMLCLPPNGVCFRAADTTQFFTGFRFENTSGSKLEKLSIEFAGGNKVISSDIEFRYCRFYKNNYSQASGALDIFQCNPLISHCTFIENQRAAILTAVNASASPAILNSTFIRNSTLNTNRPQLNLGAGDSNTPLIISGNRIEGGFSMVGGISIFMLAGTMNVLIDSNLVINNRYGINIQGNGITYAITNNRILNNNLEVNPMNGGSGISLNGLNTGLIANNRISGNLWGVTILNGATPNLGKTEPFVLNPGLNHIFDNGNSGLTYNLYNNTPNEIYAQNNYWGTNDEEIAEQGIWHTPDNTSLGQVHYLPIYQISSQKEILSYSLTDGDNQFEGTIENNQIEVVVTEGTDVSALRAIFTLSERALAYVNGVLQIPGITVNDFSQPVTYTVVAEDQSSAEYVVTVTVPTTIASDKSHTAIYPNPTGGKITLVASEPMLNISVYDLIGNKLFSVENPDPTTELDLSSLTDGLYVLEVRKGQNTEIKRLILQKQ